MTAEQSLNVIARLMAINTGESIDLAEFVACDWRDIEEYQVWYALVPLRQSAASA